MTHNTKIIITSDTIIHETGDNNNNVGDHAIIINFIANNDKKQKRVTHKIIDTATDKVTLDKASVNKIAIDKMAYKVVADDDYIYHDYLSISTDDSNLLLSNWVPSKEPIDRYDPLLKKNKKIYIKPFAITLNATRRDPSIPYTNKANIHVIYYGKSDNQIRHEFVPFIDTQKSLDPQLDIKTDSELDRYVKIKLDAKPNRVPNKERVLNKKILDKGNSAEQKNISNYDPGHYSINQSAHSAKHSSPHKPRPDLIQNYYSCIKQVIRHVQTNYQTDYYIPYSLQWCFTASILLYLGLRQLRSINNSSKKFATTKTTISMVMIASSVLCYSLALKSWYLIHAKINSRDTKINLHKNYKN